MARRLLLVVHGYPPRERAGTETHAATVAEGLRARGWQVHVIAGTRAPGRPQYSLLREPGLTRIVQNAVVRPLAQAERDGAIEALVAAEVAAFRPDLVHVHHIQFLSSGLRFPVPWVLSLHEAWLWCPAGGTLLQPDRRPCPGPAPERCGPCAAAWAPRPGPATSALVAAAGALAPLIPPERLHRAWLRLPDRWRAPVRRGGAAPEPAAAVAARREAMRAFGAAADLRLSPSAWLARAAEAQGLGPVSVLPHGVPAGAPRRGGGPLLFLGTVAWHKGPDLVVEAWRRAFPDGDPPLRLHGPVQDAAAACGHPIGPPLDRAGVASALSEARALVLGSRWPENAPLVALEARAAGCPVIAPDLGGLPELIAPGQDGWLYPAGDVDALAERMRQVVAAPPGPSRPPLSLDAHLDLLLQHYARLLGGR